MEMLKRFTNGITDDNVFKRIGWMYLSFFTLFEPAIVLSFYLLPQGMLVGKHPIISQIRFSANLWVSTLQIFGYNLIPTFLIIGVNLLAQQSRLSRDKYVPVGYTAFWGLTIFFGVVVGTWSFDIVSPAPPLLDRLVRILDVYHHSGLLEFSAYLLVSVISFKFTIWFSDRKRIIASRALKDIRLTLLEKILFVLAFFLLLCAAFIESLGIISLSG
jgi:hypothetical protein